MTRIELTEYISKLQSDLKNDDDNSIRDLINEGGIKVYKIEKEINLESYNQVRYEL